MWSSAASERVGHPQSRCAWSSSHASASVLKNPHGDRYFNHSSRLRTCIAWKSSALTESWKLRSLAPICGSSDSTRKTHDARQSI